MGELLRFGSLASAWQPNKVPALTIIQHSDAGVQRPDRDLISFMAFLGEACTKSVGNSRENPTPAT
jgi:hypothetical protein